jgi:hypothetical protein
MYVGTAISPAVSLRPGDPPEITERSLPGVQKRGEIDSCDPGTER